MEDTPQEPQPHQSSKLPLILTILLIISLVVAAGSMYIAYNALQKVKALEEQITASTSDLTETNESTKMPAQGGNDSALQTFTDPNVEGMSFQYDPTVWEVVPLTGNGNKTIDGIEYPGAGVYLDEKEGDGYLLLSYTLEFGMGGGYTLFEDSEIQDISDTLTRIQSTNRYEYGLTKELVYFNKSVDEKKKFMEFCDEMTQPDYEGYTAFDPAECADINSGKIIGYVPQPSFSWSLKSKILTSLKDINPRWDGDVYVESEGLDNGFIIVTSSYTGAHPEKADEIVKQLVF